LVFVLLQNTDLKLQYISVKMAPTRSFHALTFSPISEEDLKIKSLQKYLEKKCSRVILVKHVTDCEPNWHAGIILLKPTRSDNLHVSLSKYIKSPSDPKVAICIRGGTFRKWMDYLFHDPKASILLQKDVTEEEVTKAKENGHFIEARQEIKKLSASRIYVPLPVLPALIGKYAFRLCYEYKTSVINEHMYNDLIDSIVKDGYNIAPYLLDKGIGENVFRQMFLYHIRYVDKTMLVDQSI
jgi:hypothetical protein